jgi:peptidyl-prolyl cis-trans isomerase C
MSNANTSGKQTGNVTIMALAAVVAVGLGAFAYFSSQKPVTAAPAATQTASAETPAAAAPESTSADAKAPETIKPGNPVVAKVDGKDVLRAEVLNFMQNLPPQSRQMPIEKLFPLALDNVVNSRIVLEKTKDVKLDNDPEVKRQMDLARDQITRSVYLQKEVDKQVDDQKIKNAYAEYVKSFPDVQEVKARHILVKEESKARDIIKKLNEGGDFAALAKENSTDATAQNGGDLGYFAAADVVPEFAKAAFDTKIGEYTKTPVKSQFGYHVIKVEDNRKRPPAEFEAAKPMIEAQVRSQILDGMIKEWRKTVKVETFDINGEAPAAVAPAAGN